MNGDEITRVTTMEPAHATRVERILHATEDEVRLTRGPFVPMTSVILTASGALLVDGRPSTLVVRVRDGAEKLGVAIRARQTETAGVSLVARCVNDLIVTGSIALFASCRVDLGDLSHEMAADLVTGIARGCRAGGFPLADCELVESAAASVVLTVVGRTMGRTGPPATAGCALIGLPSAGIHSFGSGLCADVLLRKLMLGFDDEIPGTDLTVRAALLTRHKSYFSVMLAPLSEGWCSAVAHVDDGGLARAAERLCGPGLDVVITPDGWPSSPILGVLRRASGLDEVTLMHSLDMGIGMLVAVAPEQVSQFRRHVDAWNEPTVMVGRIEPGNGRVRVVGAVAPD